VSSRAPIRAERPHPGWRLAWRQLAAATFRQSTRQPRSGHEIAAARELVSDEARRLLGEALGAGEAELASLAGVRRSQIELSLPGALRDG
jgi:hypothetical protein